MSEFDVEARISDLTRRADVAQAQANYWGNSNRPEYQRQLEAQSQQLREQARRLQNVRFRRR